MEPLKIFYVDDDPLVRRAMAHLFRKAGHEVITCAESEKAIDEAIAAEPDCIITDLMMPGVDGHALVKSLRDRKEFADIPIIVASSKTFEFDRKRAMELGANGYLIKSMPSEKLMAAFEDLVDARFKLTFWGTRGTLPVPGPKTLKYGGNTCCVSLDLPGDAFFIFDAGTGIKSLSNRIMAEGGKIKKTTLFLSHPHWDHINAFPFFVPLYIPGNEIEVVGAAHGDIGVEKLLGDQMSGVYFPIQMKEFGGHVRFRDVGEGEFEIDGVQVKTVLLNHPGNCLGYRIEFRGKVICYVTDNELYPRGHDYYDANFIRRLTEFCQEADILITDCCYRDGEYEKKLNWGHSCPSEVCRLAHDADVDKLYLYHHDPDQDDEGVEEKLAEAKAHLEALGSQTEVFLPVEGETIEFR